MEEHGRTVHGGHDMEGMEDMIWNAWKDIAGH